MTAGTSMAQSVVDAAFSYIAASLWKRDNELNGLPARCSPTSNVLGCLRINMESKIASLQLILSHPLLSEVQTVIAAFPLRPLPPASSFHPWYTSR